VTGWQTNFSLRRRVLTGLFAATIGYWSVIAALTVEENVDEVHELYDIHLTHTALGLLRVVDTAAAASSTITGEVATQSIQHLFQQWPEFPQPVIAGQGAVPTTPLPNETPELRTPTVKRNVAHGLTLRYQVWRNDGFLVFQSANAPNTPITEQLGFSKTTTPDGKVWRNYSVWDDRQHLRAVVSESNEDRMQLVRSIAIKSMNPILLGMPLFILLMWLSVRRGLGPLTDLDQAIARRDANSLTPIDESKSPRELQPIVRELNKLIGRMKQSLENERRFNANAAHELNTPLAAIQTHVYVARTTTDEAERQKALDQARIGLERSIRLVGQMLAIARIDHRQAQADVIWLDLSEIAQGVCAELALLALRRDQTLELIAAPEPTRMAGSPDLLHRLISNLVDNALRYARDGGNIVVEVRRTSTGVRLTVQDDGPGIPADQLDRVFDRYYRLADQGPRGTGLGLAICRTIAEIHQGKISLAQGPGGQGLVVTCDFQVGQTEAISPDPGSKTALRTPQ
jgi:two-component system sensor histidine kinase QseC